jgi:subtilisin family serine protease
MYGGLGARTREVIAFIRLATDGTAAEELLAAHGCRSLAHYGTLHIASIPLEQLTPLSRQPSVLRIEASPSSRLLTDSMAVHLNATAAYTAQDLPQAYTGSGVVMGIMDVGFDLTHPTFYSRDTTRYRISRFWDQLSHDTLNSTFPVGRDYTSQSDILALGHSRDGLLLTHGTHTTGIAAGSGYDSPYQGMAPEADICLVANAVTDDLPLIDSTDVYKYTFATDALGFKYIFDYAQSVGRPCVISFSEGSPQDFWGYDQLYYAMLDSLTGPGRILVAAAGNEGHHTSWIHKPRGQLSAGTFFYSSSPQMVITLKSANDYDIRVVAYGEQSDTLILSTRQLLQQPDSTLQLPLSVYTLMAEAYPSCYDDRETCIDITIGGQPTVGITPQLSIEMTGADADVELWRQSGRLTTNSLNPLLCDGETTHNIHSPSSAPCVISVGETSYRDYIINLDGDTMSYWHGTGGVLAQPSSRGPTMDGRIKPDCVAPGNNIISSYSSYYMEANPQAADLRWDVSHFNFGGRTYAWNSNSGTSMAAPAVGGAIALWLQACPTLTPADVMGVISRTSRHYDPTLAYPNNAYGHGEIDVYAGLLDILGLSHIPAIPQHHTRARITLNGSQLSIGLPCPAATALPLSLYNLSGKPLHSATIAKGSSTCTIQLPSLPAGIYVLCIGAESTLIRKR